MTLQPFQIGKMKKKGKVTLLTYNNVDHRLQCHEIQSGIIITVIGQAVIVGKVQEAVN